MESNITIYSFYNNKGGVGKTTLCSHVSTLYAKLHPETMVLVVDMCPQANVSQFLLGGGKDGYARMQELQNFANRKNIVGFIDWIIDNNKADFKRLYTSYAIQVNPSNKWIAENVYLVSGDSYLESLVFTLNYRVLDPSNENAWRDYMTIVRRLCEQEFEFNGKKKYQNMVVFIDCNPSFSIYTQMALLSSDRLIIPMMADYSSIEGIKGIFMLLYGKYPSNAQEKYAKGAITFSKQVEKFKLKTPVIHQLVFNNYTRNNGIAAAYQAIQNDLNSYCYERYREFSVVFSERESIPDTMDAWQESFVSKIIDFHTSGKVAMTKGVPMCELNDFRLSLGTNNKVSMPDGSEVTLTHERFKSSVEEVELLVQRL